MLQFTQLGGAPAPPPRSQAPRQSSVPETGKTAATVPLWVSRSTSLACSHLRSRVAEINSYEVLSKRFAALGRWSYLA